MHCYLLIWKGWAILKLATDVRNWRFGLRGEQAVAEKLADRTLAAAGYSAFHDVPGTGGWNIDHVHPLEQLEPVNEGLDERRRTVDI